MFGFLHKQMQEMNKECYTGIKGLPNNFGTNLFYELYQPIEGRSCFSNERSAFSYVRNLNSSHPDRETPKYFNIPETETRRPAFLAFSDLTVTSR